MSKHYELGKEGEKRAAHFLQKHQYEILETNWRYQKAEVDIIAQKGDVIVCVEVKTRTSDYIQTPKDAISSKKIKLLVEAMHQYVVSKDLDVEVRFDIIAILQTKHQFSIEHIENAFLHF